MYHQNSHYICYVCVISFYPGLVKSEDKEVGVNQTEETSAPGEHKERLLRLLGELQDETDAMDQKLLDKDRVS